MKIISKYLCIFVLSLFAIACSDNTDPEKVAENFAVAILSNDAKTAIKLIYIPDDVKNKAGSEEFLKGKVTMMIEEVKKTTDRKGGFSSVDASDIKIDDNQKYATVRVTTKYKDGTESKKMLSLIKIDNSWLIKI